MLGWDIYIRRKNESESNDSQLDIARWTTNLNGLSWIDELVKSGNAIDLGGDGYPSRYSIKAEVLHSILLKRTTIQACADYFNPGGYNCQLEINNEKLNGCANTEELIITAWDKS